MNNLELLNWRLIGLWRRVCNAESYIKLVKKINKIVETICNEFFLDTENYVEHAFKHLTKHAGNGNVCPLINLLLCYRIRMCTHCVKLILPSTKKIGS